jgi:hypothetical protein
MEVDVGAIFFLKFIVEGMRKGIDGWKGVLLSPVAGR